MLNERLLLRHTLNLGNQQAAQGKGAGTYSMVHAKNIVRPQLRWEQKVDNTNTPFVTFIAHKPNAVVNP